jgi:butyryl-CoA dehydrogenase
MVLDLTPEQRDFQQDVDAFAREQVSPAAARIDETGIFPSDLVARAAERGLMGITVSREWGGGGRDYVSYALAIESIARASATLAVILAVNNSLVAEVVERFGAPDQKRRWLRDLATGRALGAFALSEDDAGTDAANQHTTAVRLKPDTPDKNSDSVATKENSVPGATEGNPGGVRLQADPDRDGWRLNGRKVWVANAEAAQLSVVFAATQPGRRGRGVTAFLVPLDSPGIVRTRKDDSLGVRGLGCMDLELRDVVVGPEQQLGDLDAGFPLAMWALDGGRVAIAAQALGVGQAALDAALDHARRRKTFGRAIGQYQAVQWMLADMATDLAAARMLTLKAAAAKQVHSRATVEAAMAKLYASEAAHRAADKAMQILASAGYRRGSTVERLFRDVRATEIYQGTSEVQRMVIAGKILT